MNGWKPVVIAVISFSLGIAVPRFIDTYLIGSGAEVGQWYPRLASLSGSSTANDVYLAAWQDERGGINGKEDAFTGVVAALIDPEETTVEDNFPIVGVDAEKPSVAANTIDREFLVVWEDNRKHGFINTDIYGQRVKSDGTLIGSSFEISKDPPIMPLHPYPPQLDPDVSYDPVSNSYLVVWRDGRITSNNVWHIYGQMITNDGKKVGKNFEISNPKSDPSEPSVTINPQTKEFLVVWQDERAKVNTGWDIYGQLVKTNGQLAGTEIPICTSNNDQNSPAIVYGNAAKAFLVVWTDKRNVMKSNADIYGQFLDGPGSLSGSNFLISDAVNGQKHVSLASDAKSFIVCFYDERDWKQSGVQIYARRVTLSSGPVGEDYLIVGNKGWTGYPAIAFAKTNNSYLAIWQDDRSYSTTNFDIYGQHLDSSGIPIKIKPDSSFLISVPSVKNPLYP